MKNLLLLIPLLFTTGCQADPATPTQVEEFALLKKNLSNAEATGDAAEIAAAEKALTEFETRLLRERAGPVIATLSTVAGPTVTSLSPFLLGLVPLLGRRGRKHFGSAVKELNPFQGSIAPVAAGMDLMRMLGVLHSKEEPPTEVNPSPPAI